MWDESTIGPMFDKRLRESVKQTFVVSSNQRPYEGTVGDLTAVARRLASGLLASGIKPGDVVAYQFPNWTESAVCLWALALMGAVIVPIVHIYGPKETGFILSNTGARALISADQFGHRDYLDAIPQFLEDTPSLEVAIVVGDRQPSGTTRMADFLAGAPGSLETPVDVDPGSPAVIGFTSGTTADPKGVIQTHRTFLAELRHTIRFDPGPGARPNLVASPVSHVTGMIGLVRPIMQSRPVYLMDRWDPRRALELMRSRAITAGGGAAVFLTSLLDCAEFTSGDVAYMEHVALGGSPVPAALAERADALGINIIRAYGSTEHPSTTAGSFGDDRDVRLYTDGTPLPSVQIRIVDENERELAPGQPGEIQSKGPDLFSGYTDPALNETAVGGDGWYSTGDIGIVDGHGCLTITDRKKDIIIRGGENISAAEVEDILIRVPGVAEVAVVAAPDPRYGEHGCAFLRTSGTAVPTLADLRRYLDEAGLARQKWPEEVRQVEGFDRTPSGKVKKYVLREMLKREDPR